MYAVSLTLKAQLWKADVTGLLKRKGNKEEIEQDVSKLNKFIAVVTLPYTN